MPQVFRFGAFQFNEETGELRKGHTQLKLQPQPARLLRLLVSNAGSVVKRAEIQKAVWGDDVVVDYEAGVNRCVRQIRSTLLDNPDSPRYIETVPRTGYRFIAPLQAITINEQGPEQAPKPSDVSLRLPEAAIERRKRIGFRSLTSLAFAAFLGTAAVWFVFARRHNVVSNLEAVPLTSYLGNEFAPTFSPDGRQVAFVWNGDKQNNFDIYIKLVGSSRLLRLTSDAAIDYGPAWSPDGRWIAFCRGTERSGGALYIISALGGPERKVLDLETVADPANRPITWSRDGKWIVLAQNVAAVNRDGLCLVDTVSGKSRTLTHPTPGTVDLYPAMSPSGDQVAFTRETGRKTERIYLLPFHPNQTEVTEPRQLNWRGVRYAPVAHPTWTPDGRQIVFDSSFGGSRRLWITDTREDSEPKVLALLGENLSQAMISSRGQLVYVHHSTPGVNIWRVDLTKWRSGQALTPIRTIASTRSVRSGTISPNGKKLALISDQSGHEEIWTSNLDGSDLVQVTAMDSPGPGSPSWSPDGRQIAFDSRLAGEADLYRVSAEGGTPERFGPGVIPSWSSDPRWIYFSSRRSGSLQIWRTSPSGGAPEQVTRSGGFAAKLSPDNRFLYYMRSANVVSSLLKLDLASGPEIQIAESVFSRAFAPANDGVYYFSGPPYGAQSLHFLSFESGVSADLLTVQKLDALGISVTPDGSSLFYGQVESRNDELMMVENFWQ